MKKEAIDSFLDDFAQAGARIGRGGTLSFEAVRDALNIGTAESVEDYRVRCRRVFRAHAFVFKNYEALLNTEFIICDGDSERIHQQLLIALLFFYPRSSVDDPDEPPLEEVLGFAANNLKDTRG